MKKVKTIKLKTLAKVILTIIVSIFLIIAFYYHSRSDLIKLGYSKKASDNIMFKFKKNYVIQVGKNKTLNKAFESKNINYKYLDNYKEIKYVNHKDLITNINALLKKGYSNENISMILEHGSNEDVKEFAKRSQVRYLEAFYTYSFAKIKNYDRYVKYMDEERDDEETTIINVNLDLDKEESEAVTIKTINKYTLVNKRRLLTKEYIPKDLVTIAKKYLKDDSVTIKASKEAYNALIQLITEAQKDNINILINSAYRSYTDQEKLYNEYKNLYGQSYVDKFVSKPGSSEHQTGCSFDLASLTTNTFINSSEYKYMQDNAYKYGFILRYPKGYEDITGYTSEAWHYRYVGKKIATYINKNKMTYDEYYVRFLDK